MTEVRFRHRAGKLLGQQSHQPHHIGLLDHLRALCALASDDHVDGHFAIGILREIKRFELVKASELLIDSG